MNGPLGVSHAVLTKVKQSNTHWERQTDAQINIHLSFTWTNVCFICIHWWMMTMNTRRVQIIPIFNSPDNDFSPPTTRGWHIQLEMRQVASLSTFWTRNETRPNWVLAILRLAKVQTGSFLLFLLFCLLCVLWLAVMRQGSTLDHSSKSGLQHDQITTLLAIDP